MKRDRRERRDVELHERFLNKHGAVYWSSGWARSYTDEPLNGYLYMTPESVKYRIRIEKIVRNTDLTPEDMRLIPTCRKDWVDSVATWIKIVEMERLRRPLYLRSMTKWNDHKPISTIGALQSAVKIVDEFWE